VIAAVVPLKRLSEAKSRLSRDIEPVERERLMLAMARHVVSALRDSPSIDIIAVSTPNEETALALGATYLPDAGGLNESLMVAQSWAQEIGAEGLLILPADLPLVGPADIESVVTGPSGISIASTHDGGTGALFLTPPACIPPEFGESSYARHILSARERAVPVREVDRDGLRFDLDTLDDLRHFARMLRAS
jgi:2-phospho-L-lactate guanylyltransferase